MIRQYLPRSTEELIRSYERYVSPFALLAGFTIDVIAVRVLDLQSYSFVLLFHLALAATGILLLHLVSAGQFKNNILVSGVQFIPVFVQFSFGGLFSGFLLLYSQSAAYAVSRIFVVFLAALLIGNERFRRVYATFPVRVGVLYVAVFSFVIIYGPVVSKSIGPYTFLLSGVASLAVIGGYVLLAYRLLPALVLESKQELMRAVFGVFVFMNVLYFLNAIPPLPLALRDAGVFHSITRSGAEYHVTYEPLEWYERYARYKPVFHRAPGETVYVYTALFAPAGISTTLIHEWQRYDELRDQWITHEEIRFPIVGGRDGGYRGYTLARDVRAGEWRVNVRTDYGQLVGRVTFEVWPVGEPVLLKEGIR